MTPDREIIGMLWAAQAIRAELDEVAGDEAVVIAPKLDELLGRARSLDWTDQELESVVDQIVAMLSAHEATRRWVREFREAELAHRMAGYDPVPGHGKPIPPVAVYQCPQCDFRWSQRATGQPVPVCPKDGAALDQVSS